eukprot:scaffold1281_cov88-Cylindrotheca_fusiformis.AAC.1
MARLSCGVLMYRSSGSCRGKRVDGGECAGRMWAEKLNAVKEMESLIRAGRSRTVIRCAGGVHGFRDARPSAPRLGFHPFLGLLHLMSLRCPPSLRRRLNA